MSRKSVSALGVAAAMVVGLLALPAQATDPPAMATKDGRIVQMITSDSKTIAAAPMHMSAAGKPQAMKSNPIDMEAGGYALNGTWPADEITIAKSGKAITIFTNNSAMNGATSLITANGGKLAATIDADSVPNITMEVDGASALSRAGGLFSKDGEIVKPYDGDIRHAHSVAGVNTTIGLG